MAARGCGPAEPAGRGDLHVAVLRRQRQQRNRGDRGNHGWDRSGDVVTHAGQDRKRVSSIPGRKVMSMQNFENQSPLERVIDEVRDEPIDPAVMEAAAGRVWTRIAGAASGPRLVE